MEMVWTSGDGVIDREHPLWDSLEHERLLLEDPDEYARQAAAAQDERAANLARKGTLAPKVPGAKPKPVAPVPRITLNQQEAAAAMGCSVEYYVKHILPSLKVVPGRRPQLVMVRELERWAEDNSARALR